MHGALPRGGGHPAHLPALRARRAHPQLLPGRRERGRVPHGGRDPVVLPRGGSLPARRLDDTQLLQDIFPTLASIIEHHMRGTQFHIGVDPRGRAAAPGRGGLPAHLDGRQGGRLGGDAPARQGGGDQRALVQRAAADGRLGASELGKDASPYMGRGRARLRQLQQALLEPGAELPVRRGGWRGREERSGASGPTRCSRSRCATRCCGASAGRRCWRSCAGSCSRRWGSGASRRVTRTTRPTTTGICARATRRTTRARCGAG